MTRDNSKNLTNNSNELVLLGRRGRGGATAQFQAKKKHKIIILQVSPDSLQVSASGAHMQPPSPPPRPPLLITKKTSPSLC